MPRPPRRRASTAVEAAIVLPLVVTLCLGCFDFARAVQAQMTLASAVRVAAEYGATHAYSPSTFAHWEAQIRAAATEEASSMTGFNAARLQLHVDVQGEVHVDLELQVEAVYAFPTLFAWPGLPHELTLRQQAGMRQYR